MDELAEPLTTGDRGPDGSEVAPSSSAPRAAIQGGRPAGPLPPPGGSSPSAPTRGSAPGRDLGFCRTLLRRSGTTRYVASLALPARVRDPATVLWAMRRSLEDAVQRPGATTAALKVLEVRLDRAFAGAPEEHPVDRAFAAVVRAHALPRLPFDLLLEGLAWDLAGRRHATYDALLAHCVRRTATLTASTAALAGARDATALARACDLGIAMRLTHIARDVGVDARAGRLHLPLEWLEEARVDVDRFVLHPSPTRGVRDVVLRLLRAAEPLDNRVEEGLGALPRDCRPAGRAARLADAAVADAIHRSGHDTVSRRVSLGPLETARLVARAWRPLPRELLIGPSRPAVAAAQPLVDALASTPSQHLVDPLAAPPSQPLVGGPPGRS